VNEYFKVSLTVDYKVFNTLLFNKTGSKVNKAHYCVVVRHGNNARKETYVANTYSPIYFGLYGQVNKRTWWMPWR
jgi:hypothetical protein